MIGVKRPGRGSPPMLRSPAPPRVRAGATVGPQRPLSFARTTAVGPRPHSAPGAARCPIRDRGLNLAAISRVRSTPGRPSTSEAAPGVAAAPKRSRPHQPLTVSAPKRGASQSGASRPCSPTGPRALVSPGQPQSLGSLHQERDRTSAFPPVRGGRHTLLWV
ncbi:hypothetical protein NDU88_006727 [Pleurodeles waltl]|uniref:Uncharacterized protein n=1 Tax=Pleurodeles waltl TaxID=8319 RepID=A0AAV7RNW0_PLEWA|nr:hypothetical protein NDU88_006727 [Pleurodeles waltl]